MGKHQQKFPTSSERRFMLADKLLPKAAHKVDIIESSAFGAPIPILRKSATDRQEPNKGDLRESIKSILADVK
jgi:hypothetical protein